MKINKKHGGKEFNSFFRFIGQVRRCRKGYGDNVKVLPIYEITTTSTNKPRRVLQFDVLTAEYNNIKVELAGMEMPNAYPYSSTHKKACKVAWEDRLDKTKYPDNTYHLIETDWDKAERLGGLIQENVWVDVKGKYEFGLFTNTETGITYPVIKRIINSVEVIEDDNYEVKLSKDDVRKYVRDFSSPEFFEVNFFNLEIGINTVFKEENSDEVIVNGLFLDYGKEKSVCYPVPLVVRHQEAPEGKKSLAEAFLMLNRGDVLEVNGVDNNRLEFTEVEEEDDDNPIEDNPFDDVDESATRKKTKRTISGNRKGLEITSYVQGSLKRNLLTEEEMEIEKTNFDIEIESMEGFEELNEDDIPF